MNPNNAIEVKDITKTFKVFYDKGSTIKEHVVSNKRRRHENHQVLKGISFEVKKGEAVGLIGCNGCGKSTTLKLLTKIMYPDSGSIEIQGRVSSLLELGAGFHPDMSGRENIYINASILGLSRKEVDERLDKIIDFSELGDYIDNPIRTYSSGMYMRLAFSVAINVDADVLLIDEILAVGDANFQIKCFDKLKEIKKNGTTIVIVSHSLAQIEEICERSYWIHDGEIRSGGDVFAVHDQYLKYMEKQRKDAYRSEMRRQYEESKDSKVQEEAEDTDKESALDEGKVDKQVEIKKVKLLDEEGSEQRVFLTEDNIGMEIHYRVNEPVENPSIAFTIYTGDGIMCYGTSTRIDGIKRLSLEGSGKVFVNIKNAGLLPGRHFMDCAIEAGDGSIVDYHREEFFMYSKMQNEIGIFRFKHEWKIK